MFRYYLLCSRKYKFASYLQKQNIFFYLLLARNITIKLMEETVVFILKYNNFEKIVFFVFLPIIEKKKQ